MTTNVPYYEWWCKCAKFIHMNCNGRTYTHVKYYWAMMTMIIQMVRPYDLKEPIIFNKGLKTFQKGTLA